MTVKVRFAPSPTGYVHIGNVRTALINWLFARKHKGHFLLRLDDTDVERSKKDYEEGIYEDLSWLGLTHDSFFKQSDRFDRYKAVVDQLIASGRLYPCYETPEELDFKRKRQLGRFPPACTHRTRSNSLGRCTGSRSFSSRTPPPLSLAAPPRRAGAARSSSSTASHGPDRLHRKGTS